MRLAWPFGVCLSPLCLGGACFTIGMAAASRGSTIHACAFAPVACQLDRTASCCAESGTQSLLRK
eukprot:10647599-Alexandrium_andersonii.AAC.1